MNIAWHYWCGSKNGVNDRFVKYLLISANSLVKVGGVDPSKIHVTMDWELMPGRYARAVRRLGVNLIEGPVHRQYSKQTGFVNLIERFPDIDKLVQIDCDTIVTRENIEENIKESDSCLNIDFSGDVILKDMILERNGQKHGYHPFGISPSDKHGYDAFKDLMRITFNADVDTWVDMSDSEYLLLGFLYILSPKRLPKDFFRFLHLMNLFFEDDEAGLSFARHHFKLQYDRISPLNLAQYAGEISDFDKLKGIVHFPSKDEEMHEYMTNKADEVLAAL